MYLYINSPPVLDTYHLLLSHSSSFSAWGGTWAPILTAYTNSIQRVTNLYIKISGDRELNCLWVGPLCSWKPLLVIKFVLKISWNLALYKSWASYSVLARPFLFLSHMTALTCLRQCSCPLLYSDSFIHALFGVLRSPCLLE
jgi:hypothetical protein